MERAGRGVRQRAESNRVESSRVESFRSVDTTVVLKKLFTSFSIILECRSGVRYLSINSRKTYSSHGNRSVRRKHDPSCLVMVKHDLSSLQQRRSKDVTGLRHGTAKHGLSGSGAIAVFSRGCRRPRQEGLILTVRCAWLWNIWPSVFPETAASKAPPSPSQKSPDRDLLSGNMGRVSSIAYIVYGSNVVSSVRWHDGSEDEISAIHRRRVRGSHGWALLRQSYHPSDPHDGREDEISAIHPTRRTVIRCVWFVPLWRTRYGTVGHSFVRW